MNRATPSCPEIDALFEDARAASIGKHLRDCEPCRDLASMPLAAGGGPQVDGCEDAELLIAVVSTQELAPNDTERLQRHLADCARCGVTAQSVLLADRRESVADAENPSTWSHPLNANPKQGRNLRVPALIAASVFVACAATFALVVSSGTNTSDRLLVTADPGGALTKAAPSQPIATLQPPVDAVAPVDAGAPITPDTGPVPAFVIAQDELESAIEDRDTKRTLLKCDELSRVRSPNTTAEWGPAFNRRAQIRCSIAACLERDAVRARRFSSNIRSATAREKLAQACLRRGITLYATTKAAAKAALEIDNELSAAIEEGRYSEALRICDRLPLVANSTELNNKKCTLLACRAKDASKAKRYFNRLRARKSKQDLAYVCNRYAIVLPDPF